MSYPYITRSQSDPNGDKGGLGYNSAEDAQAHADLMNERIKDYPGWIWNTSHWKTKPEPWIVIKN